MHFLNAYSLYQKKFILSSINIILIMQYLSGYHRIISEVIKMIADKIKFLRDEKGWTQTELSKKLGITRSSVNAWEMGISVPSTQYIVELSQLFGVSTDFLLGIGRHSTIDVSGLTNEDIKIIYMLIEHLKSKE